jgi:hypothetical protein
MAKREIRFANMAVSRHEIGTICEERRGKSKVR